MLALPALTHCPVSTSSLSPGQENVNPQLKILSKHLSEAPLAVKEALELAVSYFTKAGNASPHLQLTPPQDITGPSVIPSNTIVHFNIQINRQTMLETVYYYPLNMLVEYLETSVLWGMYSLGSSGMDQSHGKFCILSGRITQNVLKG